MKRGLAYDAVGEYKNAISDFTQILRLNPESEAAYFNRGSSLMRMG